MTITDKLKAIAENEERVYEAGQADTAKKWNDFILSNFSWGWGYRLFEGLSDGSDPYDIEKLPPIDTSAVTSFYGIFQYCYNITRAPALDTSSGTDFGYMLSGCSRVTEFPDYDFSNAKNMAYAFRGCGFTTVPVLNTAKCASFHGAFSGCSNLTTVEGIDFSSCTDFYEVFDYCDHLENLTVNGSIQEDISLNACVKLTRESLLSVINALKDYSEASTVKQLAMPQKALDRLTEEDIAIATAKGWTVSESW